MEEAPRGLSTKKRGLQTTVAFVGLTYAVSWTVWWIGMSSVPEGSGVQDERFWPFLLAGSFAPTLGALVLAGLSGGRASMGSLLARLVRVKVDWKVYVATFFLLPVIGLVTLLALGTGHRIELWKIAATAIALMPVNALLGGVIFGVGPLGEEMGWRGFLQERLQGQYNSVIVAGVIGIVWAIWHAPIAVHFEDFRAGLSLRQFAVLYPMLTILHAFIMGHLWRWSRGSLFVVIFFHAVSNQMVDVYLVNTAWWDFGDLPPSRICMIILFVYALMAGATELLSRTVMRPRESVPRGARRGRA